MEHNACTIDTAAPHDTTRRTDLCHRHEDEHVLRHRRAQRHLNQRQSSCHVARHADAVTVDLLLHRHGRRGRAAVLQLPRQHRPRVRARVCDTHGSSDDGITAVQGGRKSKGRARENVRWKYKERWGRGGGAQSETGAGILDSD
jgi:hypothetical protein